MSTPTMTTPDVAPAAPPPADDPPLTDAEQDAMEALGWRPAGGGQRRDGVAYIRAHSPDGTAAERTRAEWRAAIASGERAPTPALPSIPLDLPGWTWECDPARGARLVNATEGYTTRWDAPTPTATDAIAEARAREAADAALVAEDEAADAALVAEDEAADAALVAEDEAVNSALMGFLRRHGATVSHRHGRYRVNFVHGTGAQIIGEGALRLLAARLRRATPEEARAIVRTWTGESPTPADAALIAEDEATTTVVVAEVLDPLDGEPLGATLELHAQLYLDARRRVGQGTLDAARAVAAARAEARHGQWGPWLRKTGLSGDSAERLILIHAQAEAEPLFAERVRTGFLGLSVAGEIARDSNPRALLEHLLAVDLPPTVAAVRETRRALAPPNSATSRNLDDTSPAEPSIDPLTLNTSLRSLLAKLDAHNAQPLLYGVRAGPLRRLWEADIATVRRLADAIHTGDHAAVSRLVAKIHDAILAQALAERHLVRLDRPDSAHVEALRTRAKSVGFDALLVTPAGYELIHRGARYSLTADLAPVEDTIRYLEAPRPAPAIADPAAEVDLLIAELTAIEARIAADAAGDDDRRALDRISQRADQLGAYTLGAHAEQLRRSLGAATPTPDAELAALAARDVLARLDALEAPADGSGAFHAAHWERRAHAAGANLKAYEHHWQLVEPGGAKREYPNGCEDQLAARIVELEGQAGITAPAAPLPARVVPAPDPADEESDAIPADARDAYRLAERALAEELQTASPRLRRLLYCAFTATEVAPDDLDQDTLFDALTEGLLMTADEALTWALGEAPDAPARSSVVDSPDAPYDLCDSHDLAARISLAELMAERGAPPPTASDLTRWQAALDALVSELDDGTYEAIAGRIGALRAAREAS